MKILYRNPFASGRSPIDLLDTGGGRAGQSLTASVFVIGQCIDDLRCKDKKSTAPF